MSNPLSHAVWRKSSRSSEQGACVELAQNIPGMGAIRDSKHPDQTPLILTPAQLHDLLSIVKTGALDR